jgi:hypothetical protein
MCVMPEDEPFIYARINEDDVPGEVFAEFSSERITLMKRADLTVYWNLQDDGGFWRLDALVYRSAADYEQQVYKFHREFEKKSFDDQSVGTIMKRANGYLDYLIANGDLDAWYNSSTHAAP